MKERDFRRLLDKSVDSTISENESQLLNKFEEELISRENNFPFQGDSDKKRIKKALWNRIVFKTMHANNTLRKWRVVASIAATLVCFLLIKNFYFQVSSQFVKNTMINNAITLELEDGSLRIIEENGSVLLTDKNGIVLGQQIGNGLVYSNNEEVDELRYNKLTVPFGKTFELKLSDGSKVHLNSGSSLKYPVKFLKNQERIIFITGEAFLDVSKDSLRPFIVNTNKMSVRVLGTKFNLSAYPEDDTSDVVLIEGAVSLYAIKENNFIQNSVLLNPGFKGSFDKKSNEITTDPVLTSLYTSWMNGELIFRNMTFNNITKKLERHYNVSIVNQNKELESKKFNANFGNESIGKVLQELKVNYGIDFEFNERGDIIIH